MFSAKLIQKKVGKVTSHRRGKDDDTLATKRKRKNGKAAQKSVPSSAKKPKGNWTVKGADAAADASIFTPAQTDINKNKVTRSTHNNHNNNNSTTTDRKKDKNKNKRRKRRNNTKIKSNQASTEETTLPKTQDKPTTPLESRASDETEPHHTNSEDQDSTLDTLGSDSDHSMSGRKQRHGRNPPSSQATSNQCLVGECLTAVLTERGSVLAALAPDTTLYLQGCVVVCPVLGQAEVLGCVLRQGERQTVYSLPSCSLLGVKALEGVVVDGSNDAFQGLPSSWVESLAEKHTPVTLLEIHPSSSPRVNILVSAGWGALGKPWDWQKPWHSIGASVVTRGNCHKHRLTHLLPEWTAAAQTVAENWQCGAVPRVVVCGGKGVGKTTFFKYLANTLISADPNPGILILDFDPGQPELSLPTSLSLTHLTKPLLGPSYTHDLKGVSSRSRQILVGAVSPQFVLDEYVCAVRELCREAGVMGGNLPLLVNTMGWTQGTGLSLMLDIVRLVGPTHVIQIQDRRQARNYPFPLDCGAVGEARSGIATRGGDLHYALTLLPSAGPGVAAPHMAQPKVLRELRVLAEAGVAAESGSRVTVPWGAVALHVCQEQVPRDRILQALNAQLVALCRVEAAGLHTLDRSLPQLLVRNAGFGELGGGGVVMGVDPLTSDLHLATSLTPQQVTQRVNAIVMPRIHLPAAFYKMFCLGKGPYLEEGSREGAGRLRIGRKIKPRGPKK